jgi:DNA-binding NtrC family response regulator
MREKGNLLIIDDEPLLLEKTSILLEDIADNVFTAVDGGKGLEILSKEEIHCVVCDINMPEMNGIQVIEKIREDGVDVPFIFYTGHGSRELMKAAVKFGAFDFIDKPNLDGLEEACARGLKIGLRENDLEVENDFISEYKELMDATNPFKR